MESTERSILDQYCGSMFWNSNITWYTEYPTLTPCFKLTAVTWFPCFYLWLWSSYHVYIAKSSTAKGIPWTILNITKFGICLGLIILETAHLIKKLTSSPDVFLDRLLIHSLILKICTFGLSLFLDVLSKWHGIRSSGVQFIFWFLLVICQSIVLSTNSDQPNWTQSYDLIIDTIYTVLIALQLFLNCWADSEPVYSQNSQVSEKLSPEEASSFLSRLLFFWFEGLARKGHKKPLEFSDLWELAPENSSKTLNPIFTSYWNSKSGLQQKPLRPTLNASFKKTNSFVDVDIEYKPDLSNGPTSPSSIVDTRPKSGNSGKIMSILMQAFGGSFLFGCFLKLIQDLLSFATPFILRKILRHIQSDEEQWKGYFYALLLFVVTVLGSLVGNQYMYRMWLIGLRVRTTIVGCIYRKSLKISSSSREESTVGEIVNLMSVDAQKLTDMCPYLNIVWSAPILIGLSLYFLHDLLGASVFAGLGVMILLIPVNAIMGIKVKAYQTKQMKNKDKRIKLMNEILGGIKVLKLYAWEPSFEAQVTKIREDELIVLKDSAYVSSMAMFVWTCAPVVVAIATFATYILSSPEHSMNAEKAFVSLSYLNIMRVPLNLLPMMLVSIIQASVSVGRINKYMNQEEVDEEAVQRDSGEEKPVVIRNGFFSWRKEEPEQLTLRNISLEIGHGELVAIVGNVGTGKSSLLAALLGEIHKIEGVVNMKGDIAYVAQQPWIQNATVRDNILFGRPFETSKYDQILEGCALKPDLEILPGGDQTEIGEKGINLSGGQKQRVSLARAVYNNSDVYLLDDVLSAVDSHVGKLLFNKIIGPQGILSQKTRILVTHGITFLPQMDKIIVLKDGEITESGTYRELLVKKGEFAEFLVQHIVDEGDEAIEIVSDLEAALGTKKDELLKTKLISKEKESMENGNLLKSKSVESLHSNKNNGNVPSTPTTRLIDEEGVEEGIVKWNVFWYYLKAIGWKMVLVSIILQLVFQGFAVGSNIWLAIWSDDEIVNGTQTLKNEYLCGYASFGVGQALSIFVATLVMAIGTLNASGLLHRSILRRILHAPMWFFDTTPLGRIVNRLGKDVEVLDNAVSMSLTSWLKCLFNVFATILIISYTTPAFILVVIPTIVLYAMAQRYYIASSRQLRRLESVSRSPIYSHFTETLTGVTTIRAFSKQELFINKSESIVDQNQMCSFPSIVSARFLAVFLETLGNLVIFFAALFAVTYTKLSPGLVGLSLSYALQITWALNWLVETTNNVENNLVAVERLKEYNEIVQEAGWESKEVLPKSWPESGEVTFEKYETKYRPELDTVLHHLSCQIKPQEKIGICGRTGAGKSSLALALFRLIEATNGSIIIDQKDIFKIGLHQLRKNLTIIPQDPVIFAGTVRFNLDPFELYSDEDLWNSLSLAHLKGFVKEKAAGLNYELVEGGENLSVGQRQLICLARALLRKTKILVLDEATAAIDLETDELIQQTIRKEFSDATILTIAHRLNTIMDYSRILVLESGKLIEFDSPANLLQDKNSTFYSLAKDAGLV